MTPPAPAPSNRESAENRRPPGLSGSSVSLGMNMAVGMVIFAFIGYRIDARRGGGVFWTIAGMFLGLVYAAYEVWKAVRSAGDSGPPRGTGPGEPRP